MLRGYATGGVIMTAKRSYRVSSSRLRRQAILRGRAIARNKAKLPKKIFVLSRTQAFDDVMSVCRRLVLNLTFIIASCAIFLMLFKAIMSPSIMIEPVPVPPTLLQRGYTPEVFAKRIASEIKRIDRLSKSVVPRQQIIGMFNQPDIQIPGQALSFQTLVKYTKELLKIPDSSVIIDVTEENGEYFAQISINQGPYDGTSVTASSMTSSDSKTFVGEVARATMRAVQPIILASYEVSIEEARCRQSQCDFEKALALYDEIIMQPPTHDDKWALLGTTYVLLMSKRYQEAIEVCQKVLKLDPKYGHAYNNWGLSLFELGRYDEAIEKYKLAAELNPKYDHPYNNWGRTLFELRRYDEAIEKYKLAAELNPNLNTTYNNWGNALYGLKRYGEAIEKYKYAAELNPNLDSTYNNLGLAYFEIGRYDEALASFDKAIQLNKKSHEAWISKSKIYFNLGHYKKASYAYEEAMKLRPDLRWVVKDSVELKMCIDRVMARDEYQAQRPNVLGDPIRAMLVIRKMWPNGSTLRISFMGGEHSVQKKVEHIAREWSKYSNIKFNFGTVPESEIRISFWPGASWSYIGTDALVVPQNKPTMNFGWLTTASPDQEYRKVVLHEFGHALGLDHEHQKPPLGIPWDKTIVYKYFGGPPNFWSKQQVDHMIFRKYDIDHINGIKFDPKSIMSFPIAKELLTSDSEVEWNSTLSDNDKNFIGSHLGYPFDKQ